MTTIHPLLRSAGLACVGLAFAGGLWAADANSPQSYAQRLPLVDAALHPPPGRSVVEADRLA